MGLESWTFDEGGDRPTYPIGEYTYREVWRSSGTGSLGTNSTATRIFLVDWEYHTEFLNDLIGYSQYDPDTATGLSRVLPDEHPDYWYFYAVDAQIKPVGRGYVSGSGNSSTWDIAEITTTYKPVPYAVRTDDEITTELDRYVSRTPKAAAQFASANNMGMFFVYNQEPLQFTPGVIIPECSMVYTWHQIPAVVDYDNDFNSEYKIPNLSTFLGLLGKTNSTEFDTYAPGTMLLVEVGGEMRMPQTQDGLYYWDIQFGFIQKDFGVSEDDPTEHAGVNYIYDFKDGKFRLVTMDGTLTGKRIYGSGDLNQLFTVAV